MRQLRSVGSTLLRPFLWVYDLLRNPFDTAQTSAYFLLLLGSGAAFVGYLQQYVYADVFNFLDNPIADFYANTSAELISIAITVLIIDRANRRESEQERKAELILQMGSPDNAFAREAVRKLRVNEWLIDGALENANLNGANLQYADISQAILTSAELKNANLQGANLKEANLTLAYIDGSDLKEANLTLAKLRGAEMRFVTLDSARLWKADLSNVRLIKAKMSGADLVRANLNSAHLRQANLSGANLKLANLRSANLDEANLFEATLTGADLENATLENANLSGADLSDAKLLHANLKNAKWETTPFDMCFTAILPDGTEWTPDRDMREFTHPEEWQAGQGRE